MKLPGVLTATILLLCACWATAACGQPRRDDPYARRTGTGRDHRPSLRAGRFLFPPGGGDWQISYPPGWTIQRDRARPSTWVFISSDDRTRLMLTRGELKPASQGEDLEEKNLQIGRRLAAVMSQSARAPARCIAFVNNTCHGFYYTLEARTPRPGDFAYVTGLSAVKGGFHLTGYFQSKDPPSLSAFLIMNMIRSISYGDPRH